MVVRGIGGIVLVVLGAVWIAQGTGVLGGSGMSGKGQYAVLGAVVVPAGLALLGLAWRVRGRDGRQRP